MLYSEIRPKIRSGDLLAWSHVGWDSWHDVKIQAVRAFTQSEYSHVATAWVIGDRVFVIEAVQPLVRIFPLSSLLEDGCYWVPMGAPWLPQTEALALSKVGERYSQREAVQAFFELPTENSLWQCAELTRRIAASDGIDLGNRAVPTAIMKQAMLSNPAYLIDPTKK